MYIYVTQSQFPTLQHVAAHRRHVALVYQISDWHVPASCSAFTSVAAPFSFQVFDVDTGICFLHHDDCIVRSTGTWCKNRTSAYIHMTFLLQFEDHTWQTQGTIIFNPQNNIRFLSQLLSLTISLGFTGSHLEGSGLLLFIDITPKHGQSICFLLLQRHGKQNVIEVHKGEI